VDISYSEDTVAHKFAFVYIKALRGKLDVPTEIAKAGIDCKPIITQNASQLFLQHILQLYAQYLIARDEGENEAEVLKAWFDNFKDALKEIYDSPSLELKPDMKNLSLPDREPFALHEMSDGCKALLNIYMELVMRFETRDNTVNCMQSAIVFIDEIETHLHVALQRKVMPFLTRMFPNAQFIVTTHSPFVITSLENAIVYDLETKMTLENPFGYSYDAVVERYLDLSLYSSKIAGHFARYKELAFKPRTIEESKEFIIARFFLDRLKEDSDLYKCYHDMEAKRKKLERYDNV
jgi:predicted ATP-binding protein involved in virulence